MASVQQASDQRLAEHMMIDKSGWWAAPQAWAALHSASSMQQPLFWKPSSGGIPGHRGGGPDTKQ